MYKIILSSILITSPLYASDQSTIELLETAQGYVDSMSTDVKNPNCESCNSKELVLACRRELCLAARGTKDNVVHDGQSNPVEREEIAKQVRELLYLELEEATQDASSKLEFINNNLMTSNEEALRLFTIFSLMDLDEDASKSLPKEFSIQYKKIQELTEDTVNKNISYYQSTEDYFNKKYAGLSFNEAVKLEIKEVKEKQSVLFNNLTLKSAKSLIPTFDRIEDTSVYANVMAGKEISSGDAGAILDIARTIVVVTELFDDPQFKKLQNEIDLKKVKEFSHSKLIKKNLSDLNGILRGLKTKPDVVETLVDYCANQFVNSGASMASDEERKNLQVASEKLKKRFEEKILSKLSGESKSKMLSSMKNWRFTTQTHKEYINNLKSNLKNRSEEIRLSIKRTANLSKSEKEDINSDVLEVVALPTGDDITDYVTHEVFDNYSEVCLEDLPTGYSDASIPALGTVFVSGSSLKNPAVGSGVISHEMGHILLHEFEGHKLSTESSKTFNNVQSCLRKKHGTDQYVTEDFADLIEGLSMDVDSINSGCFMDINTEKPLKQGRDHSASFFRLLHIEKVSKGQVPATCERYMKQSPIKKNYDNCWPTSSK